MDCTSQFFYDSRKPAPYQPASGCRHPDPCYCPRCDDFRIRGIEQRRAHRDYERQLQTTLAWRKHQAEEAAKCRLEEEKIRKEAEQKVKDIERGKAEREKDAERGKKAREEEVKREEQKHREKEVARCHHGRCHSCRYTPKERKWLEKRYDWKGGKSYVTVVKASTHRRRSSSGSSSWSCGCTSS